MKAVAPERFYEAYSNALEKGLTEAAAYGYAALMWWGEHYGIPAVAIGSGRRSSAAQARLWANRGSNPYPVAAPGTSKHEKGEAFDLPSSARLDVYGAWAPYAGLRWGGTFTRRDPIHFELEG